MLDITRPAEALQPNSPSCGNQPANTQSDCAVAYQHARQLINLVRPPEAAPVKPSERRFALPPDKTYLHIRFAVESTGTTGTRIPAFQGAAFVRGESTPDPGVLAGVHGPSQAGNNDVTATADHFCLFDLEKRGVGVPDREEQLRTHVQTGSAVAPRR